MKTKLLAASCAAAMIMTATVAEAQEPGYAGGWAGGWYLSLFGGASFQDDVSTTYTGGGSYNVTFDDGYVIGGALGTEIYPNLRAELEVSYSDNDGDRETRFGAGPVVSGGLETFFVLGNLWYDIPLDTFVQPYLGGGLGYGHAKADAVFGPPFGYGGSDDGVAYQLGAGLRFAVLPNADLDVGYRFKGIFDKLDFPDTDGVGVYTGGKVQQHNLQARITFHFGSLLGPQ